MCLLLKSSTANKIIVSTILFSHSYFLRFDPKQWAQGQPYAPLGTLYAAAFMREKDYAVSFFDTMFAHNAEEIIPILDKESPDIFIIYDDGFNYLTKMCLTNMREAAFKMIGYAKERGCTIIVSSSDSTDHFEKYLDHSVDVVIKGEAEQTLLELVNQYSNNNITDRNTEQQTVSTILDLDSIKGLIYRTQGETIHTPKREVMRDLDALPLPAWDLVDMQKYKSIWTSKYNYFSINIATTRGCPFKCNWCAKPIYGNRYNSRSPQSVVEELIMLKQLFDFDHVWFCDDIFGLKPGWVKEFAALVQENNLRFNFKIQSRVDLLLQEEYTDGLARAGCQSVWMGAESGSQKILDAMDKGTRVEQIYEATHLLKRLGINPCFFIQFGYLDETINDIRLTIKMINDLIPSEIGISVSYPLPGTLFYDKVKQDLQQKSNWSHSNDLDLMFRNTYQPEFYKQLHKYVHSTFHKKLAIECLKQLLIRPWQFNLAKLRKGFAAFYYGPSSAFQKLKLNALSNEYNW